MRFILICLAAVLLSGCGYIAGKRVDFASDFSKYPHWEINALAGKTLYISNYEDYERLIQLKKDLRQLSNSPTPTGSLQEGCVRDILQITRKYDTGYLGFFYWGKVSDMGLAWIPYLIPILAAVGTIAMLHDFIKSLFKQSK